jgi:hypothetical protein
MGSIGLRLRVREMARLLRTNPRRVEGWVEQGLLKPVLRGRGPGRPHVFTRKDLLLGALLLEVQAAFGEKSPVCRRLFPDVSDALVGIADTAKQAGDAILCISLGGRDVLRDVPRTELRTHMRDVQAYVARELRQGRIVTTMNVGGVLSRLPDHGEEVAEVDQPAE